METVTVGIHEAEEATAAALGELGWSIQDAKIQAEIMLYAELRGSNQGMYYSDDLEEGAVDSALPSFLCRWRCRTGVCMVKLMAALTLSKM